MRGAILGIAVALAGPAAATPNSAIPWLSEILTNTAPPRQHEAIPSSSSPSVIDVTPLTTDQSDGIGLLPTSITGFPRDLWQGMSSLRARKTVAAADFGGVPENRALLRRLLLSDAVSPVGAGASDAFLLARIDKLLEIGALVDAEALLDQIDTTTPALFRRWFDIKLLTGRDNAACAALKSMPTLAPGRAVEVFCLARNGDWDAAELTLHLATELGDIDPYFAEILRFFLDPAEIETATPPPPRYPATPFDVTLRRGAGLDLTSEHLPIAFSFSEIAPTIPVRYRMETLERLVRQGLIDPAPLFAAYREEVPAASGGVWDRARFVQDLDRAVTGPAVAEALGALDAAMSRIGLRHSAALDQHRRLAELAPSEIPTEAHDLIATYLLLADDRPHAAAWITDQSPAAIKDAFAPHKAVTAAISGAFARTLPPQRPARAVPAAENILRAVGLLAQPAPLDPRMVTGALRILRASGQDRAARRIAVQYLLLPQEIRDAAQLD